MDINEMKPKEILNFVDGMIAERRKAYEEARNARPSRKAMKALVSHSVFLLDLLTAKQTIRVLQEVEFSMKRLQESEKAARKSIQQCIESVKRMEEEAPHEQ